MFYEVIKFCCNYFDFFCSAFRVNVYMQCTFVYFFEKISWMHNVDYRF